MSHFLTLSLMQGTPQTPSEQREGSSAYTKGVYLFELRHHFRGVTTFDVYIREMGEIVTITNENTLNNELKMKVGNSLKLVPEDPILFLTPEVYAQLGIPEDMARNRRPTSLKPIPTETTVTDLADEFSADITGVYERVTHEPVEDIPDSSQKVS